MSNMQDPIAFRKALLGITVTRAAAALPQTAQAAIFTVTGGKVLVTSLVGEVTTIIQAQATTAQFVGNPTTGTDVNWSNATADLNAKEVGSTITLPATFAGTALANTAGGNGLPLGTGFIAYTGTIDFKTGASSTGALKWLLTYVPLDDGAAVVAA
jgi:hypothetical protein